MLTGAVITASVAVVVAVLTQIATSVGAGTDRRYAARRAALLEAQDAALAYRTALLLYGNALPTSVAAVEGGALADVPAELDNDRITTHGAFTVAVSRVEDPHIALALERWAQTASRRFIDVRDVSATIEQAWFSYCNRLIAVALPRADCQTTDKARAEIIQPAIPPGVSGGPVDVAIDLGAGAPTLLSPSGGLLGSGAGAGTPTARHQGASEDDVR
jgi:hypothetical protein